MKQTMTITLILGVSLLLTCNGAPVMEIQSTFTCTGHLLQIESENVITEEAANNLDYLPTCEEDGIMWKPEQCHQIYEVCFCVNPETGHRRADTQTAPSIEELNCDSSSSHGPCQIALERYNEYIEENPGVLDFGYVPSCTENGQFEAMQRDENFFFCVDTTNGEIIPQTLVAHGETTRAISEAICQEYFSHWEEFSSLYDDGEITHKVEPVEGSCSQGFEFQSCGCAKTCSPGSNMSKAEFICAVCEPVCVCPDGLYNYNGVCVTNDDCMTRPLETLDSDVKNLLWGIFLRAEAEEFLNRTSDVVEKIMEEIQLSYPEEEEEEQDGKSMVNLGEERTDYVMEEDSGDYPKTFEMHMEENGSTYYFEDNFYNLDGSNPDNDNEEESDAEAFEETQLPEVIQNEETEADDSTAPSEFPNMSSHFVSVDVEADSSPVDSLDIYGRGKDSLNFNFPLLTILQNHNEASKAILEVESERVPQ